MRPPPRPPRTSGSLCGSCAVAIAERGSEQDHRVVEDGGIAFLHVSEFPQQIGVLLDMPAVDDLVLAQLVLILLMMRDIVMARR